MVDDVPVEALLEGYAPPLASIAERLRRVVLEVYPDAIERVRAGWNLIGYDIPVPGRRKPAYFAWIWLEPVHVHLGFQWGALMDDPESRMAGRGVTKRVRWLTFVPGDPIRRRDLEKLIREAARVAVFTKGERLARAIDLEPATIQG
jgi:hypothetical protein